MEQSEKDELWQAYERGKAEGMAAARSDIARMLWRALGEHPLKNSSILDISLRIEALRKQVGQSTGAEHE